MSENCRRRLFASKFVKLVARLLPQQYWTHKDFHQRNWLKKNFLNWGKDLSYSEGGLTKNEKYGEPKPKISGIIFETFFYSNSPLLPATFNKVFWPWIVFLFSITFTQSIQFRFFKLRGRPSGNLAEGGQAIMRLKSFCGLVLRFTLSEFDSNVFSFGSLLNPLKFG